jgi:soluble lytic murein transglycosylase-like protein
MSDNNIGSPQAYINAYGTQIKALEAAAAGSPNASAYDKAEEQQFDAVKAQVLGPQAGQNDFSSSNTPSRPSGQKLDGVAGSPPSTGLPSAPSAAAGPSSSNGESLNTANLPPALQQDAPMIEAASHATGVSPLMIAAQAWQESRGNVNATSTNPGNGETDTGLMQINPATFAGLQQEHPELQGQSLSNPATDVLAAAYLDSDNLNKYGGNVNDALRAYNSGSVDPSNPNIAPGGIGDPNYVSSVDSIMSDLQTGQALPA